MEQNDSVIYERIIHYDPAKENQIRLTINTFRGVEYLHLRKYFLSFEDEWQPTKDGVSFPLSMENSRELFEGLTEILSLAESKEIIERYFKNLISDIYTE